LILNFFEEQMDVRKSPKHVLEQIKSAQVRRFTVWLLWTATASIMAGTMQIITCCVRSGAYEQDLQTLDVRKGQIDINGRSVMVNTPNGEKKACTVRHGTHMNSYSPCDVWYNTSSRVVCVHVPKINPFKLSILGEKTTTFLGTNTNRPRVTLD